MNLWTHIPIYAPGTDISFGCGIPNWGAATNRNFELEKRRKWPIIDYLFSSDVNLENQS